MKTNEQALTEWMLDEIKFNGGKNLTTFNRKQMEVLAEAIRENKSGLEFELDHSSDETQYVLGSAGWALNWDEAKILHMMAKGAAIPITVQWLLRFESITEARKHVLESWAYEPIVLPEV